MSAAGEVRAEGASQGKAADARALADEELERFDRRPLSWAILRRVVALTAPYAKLRNWLLALVFVRALQLPALSWATAAILAGPIAQGDARGALLGVLGFVAWLVFTEWTFTWRMRLALSLGENVVHDLRNAIYARVLELPMSFFDKMPVGRLLSRATSDVDVLRVGVQDVFFVSVVQAGGMLVAACIMLAYDWLLFCVVALLVPILWALLQYFRERLHQAYRDVQETYSRVTAFLAEAVRGIRVIQAYRQEAYVTRHFGGLVATHAKNHLHGARQSARFLPLLELNTQLFLAIVIVVGGYRALGGQVELEVLIQFLFLSELFFGPIAVLGRQYHQALTAVAGAERVFALLDRQAEWTDEAGAEVLTELAGDVRFEGVSFGYGAGREVLSGVSFEVRAGQTVALVGPSGGGKTTITRLLAKLYLPTSGRICIDDRPLAQIDSRSLHAWLGSVPQDNLLFQGTVGDNIRFAVPHASDEQVLAACRRIGIEDVIAALPDGLATDVGDKGANLSSGERQLVCIARAMLAEPRLLVLDEATSAVDSVTEARVQRALRELRRGRTTFIVAHRTSTIRDADSILVVEQGRVAERGSHDELLALGGKYAALVKGSM